MTSSAAKTFSLRIAPILLLACASCASTNVSGPQPGQLEIQVSESSRAAMEPDVARASIALHSFLVGQLAYDREDFATATTNLARASKFAGTPAPVIHSTLAELLINQRKLDDALAETDKALESAPLNSQLLLLKGGILEALGRPDDALETYAVVIKNDAKSLDAVYQYAALSASQKRYAQAITVLESFLESNPASGPGRYLLALVYEQNHDYEKADLQLRTLLKKNSQNLSAEFDEIRVLLKQNDRPRAAALAQDLLSHQSTGEVLAASVLKEIVTGEKPVAELLKDVELFAPDNLNLDDLRLKLALAHVQEQHFNDALRNLTIVLAHNPDYSLARYYRASIYGGAGRNKEALEDLLAIKPGQELFVKSRTFAAFLMKQEKDYPGAEQAVREALQAEPENDSVFAYLILVLREAKQYNEALDLINDALRKEPNSERLLFNQGIIYNDLGRTTAAGASMEKVVQINPRHADALNFVAYSLAEQRSDLDRAEELIRRALDLSPRNGFYLDTLGWIYYQRGNYAQAAETLKESSELSGGDVIVSEHYGDALVKAGNAAQAAEVYRTALEKGRDQNPDERDTEVTDALPRLEAKLAEIVKAHPELAMPEPIQKNKL